MTSEVFLTVALNGLTVASLYFVVASGFSLIFGLMRTVNMAHGSLLLIGAYAGISIFYPLYDADNPHAWTIALILGVLSATAAGAALQVVFLGWMPGQELRQTLVTIGLSIVIADQLLAIYGGTSQQFFAPALLSGPVALSWLQGGQYPSFRLFQIAVAIAVGLGLWLLLHRTKLGIVIRAGVDDRSMLSALGVNIAVISLAVFAIGAGLAGLGGIVGGTAQPFGQGKDDQFLLTSLVVVIVGGMGSISGTAIGAILIGMAEQFGLALMPAYSVILSFVVMVVVLALRPQGIMGRTR